MSSTRAESCGSLAALTHLRLVVEYYVIIPNKTVLVAFIAIARVLLHGAEQILRWIGTTVVPHGLRSRSRDTYLHSEVANPHYVALVKGGATGKHPRFTFPELHETADENPSTSLSNLMQTDETHWPEQTVSIIGPRGRMCGRLASELRYCCTARDLFSIGDTGFIGRHPSWR
jgi:hypothetical protein